jgi:hypothetical protein
VKLNPEKTEVINVSKALQTHPNKYILGDQEINRVQSIKHASLSGVVSIGSAPISV